MVVCISQIAKKIFLNIMLWKPNCEQQQHEHQDIMDTTSSIFMKIGEKISNVLLA